MSKVVYIPFHVEGSVDGRILDKVRSKIRILPEGFELQIIEENGKSEVIKSLRGTFKNIVPGTINIFQVDMDESMESVWGEIEASFSSFDAESVCRDDFYGCFEIESARIGIWITGIPELSEQFADLRIVKFAIDDFILSLLLDEGNYKGIVRRRKFRSIPYEGLKRKLREIADLLSRNGFEDMDSKLYVDTVRVLIRPGVSYLAFVKDVIGYSQETALQNLFYDLKRLLSCCVPR